jgi:hypothetical protein
LRHRPLETRFLATDQARRSAHSSQPSGQSTAKALAREDADHLSQPIFRLTIAVPARFIDSLAKGPANTVFPDGILFAPR